jgi:hypothetical protein
MHRESIVEEKKSKPSLRARHRYAIIALIALCITAPRPLSAQSAPTSPLVAFTTDSVAWQRVLAYVVTALSAQLVTASRDTMPRPWQIRLPSQEKQSRVLDKELRTLLRARDPVPADTLVHSLEIGPLRISRDTARVNVRFAETRTCPGNSRTTGFGWSTTVILPREPRQKFWGVASSRGTYAGDRAPCPAG